MKYAYEDVPLPELKISMKQNHHQLIVQIKDNGKGLDTIAWEKQHSSFGKQLIKMLSKQLRAVQSVTVNHGTEFTFTIPFTGTA